MINCLVINLKSQTEKKYRIEQKPEYIDDWDPRANWYRGSYCYSRRRRRSICFDVAEHSCLVFPVFFIWNIIRIIFEK